MIKLKSISQTGEQYNRKTEQNMANTVKENNKYDPNIWKS